MQDRKYPALVRQEVILDLLAQQGFASTLDVASRLSVSDMTVRRDLDALAEKGLIVRTHGGAVLPDRRGWSAGDMVEPDVAERGTHAAEAKHAIARRAARLLVPGASVALDIGTTVLKLAHRMDDHDGDIFTTSLPIATALKAAHARVFMPGGRLQGTEPSLVGAETVAFLDRIRVDTVFLGASGLAADGLFDYSIEDSEVKRMLIARARRRIALVDSSKLERVSVAQVCDLEGIDVVVTEAAPPARLAEALETAGVEVLLAGRD